MRKKTARHTPDSPKASPNQTSGLIAKGQQPGESVQEECVLDNRSHRTRRTMRKKTARHTPDSPKASPNQTSGLIAKGQQPGESVQEECVLDNRSHRTFRGLRTGPIKSFPGPAFFVRSHFIPGPARFRPVGSEVAAGDRSRRPFC